ncbi:Os11g0649801, partial [Oryza sativa Japonica Group]
DDGVECAVCLAELEKGDEASFLPRCSHGFHAEYVDMWLGSHSTCQLCRLTIVTMASRRRTAGGDRPGTCRCIPRPTKQPADHRVHVPRRHPRRHAVPPVERPVRRHHRRSRRRPHGVAHLVVRHRHPPPLRRHRLPHRRVGALAADHQHVPPRRVHERVDVAPCLRALRHRPSLAADDAHQLAAAAHLLGHVVRVVRHEQGPRRRRPVPPGHGVQLAQQDGHETTNRVRRRRRRRWRVRRRAASALLVDASKGVVVVGEEDEVVHHVAGERVHGAAGRRRRRLGRRLLDRFLEADENTTRRLAGVAKSGGGADGGLRLVAEDAHDRREYLDEGGVDVEHVEQPLGRAARARHGGLGDGEEVRGVVAGDPLEHPVGDARVGGGEHAVAEHPLAGEGEVEREPGGGVPRPHLAVDVVPRELAEARVLRRRVPEQAAHRAGELRAAVRHERGDALHAIPSRHHGLGDQPYMPHHNSTVTIQAMAGHGGAVAVAVVGGVRPHRRQQNLQLELQPPHGVLENPLRAHKPFVPTVPTSPRILDIRRREHEHPAVELDGGGHKPPRIRKAAVEEQRAPAPAPPIIIGAPLLDERRDVGDGLLEHPIGGSTAATAAAASHCDERH